MKNLITNPLTRAAIAGAVVWLASVFMAHGQNKPDDLKQRILVQAQSIGADDYAFTRTIRSEPTANGIAEQVADLTGSGMGQEGRLHQRITYSDYRAVK